MAKSAYQRLDAFDDDGALNVVIETPRTCRNKFKWEPELGVFTLHKVLPAGMAFPLDVGFVPGTLGEDGDPLDVLLIADEPTFTGCLIPARLLGVLEAEQKEKGKKPERNDRLFAVSAASRDHSDLRKMKDMNGHALKELETFFVNYNELENRKFKVLGYKGRATAEKLLKAGRRARSRKS
jgi:inorganic pyrophosphatase